MSNEDKNIRYPRGVSVKRSCKKEVSRYFENLNETTKQYFHILSEEIPDFLENYIETPALQRQKEIYVVCGTCYSKMYDPIWYSRLDHSVGVALIIWHFTKDKKQPLAGLFHDISTPVFSHTIDYMNGDYETQESTEELTTKMIAESKEIMCLLKRDNIKIEEICDYHIYPIADNDSPNLASDRLEYTFSNGFGVVKKLWTLDEIKEIYQNIEIQRNEQGIEELGFRDVKMAEKFVAIMSQLSSLYIDSKTKFSMQFLADCLKIMCKKNLITVEDLYHLSEKEVIEKIENCEIGNLSECFKKWRNATQIQESDIPPGGIYAVTIEKVKIRCINPLVRISKDKFGRVSEVSRQAKQDIEEALRFKTKKYAYLDFKMTEE